MQLIEQALEAKRAGAGMWGTLYRGLRKPRWYRLIPNRELDLAQRDSVRKWQNEPRRPGLAPIVGGPDQQQFGSAWFHVVSYEVDAERNLADEITSTDHDPRAGVKATSTVLRALPGWWDGIGVGLAPMPADIVFTQGGPLLLTLPPMGTPSIEQILAEPERIAHLAPEIVRGCTGPRRAGDLFSVSVMALRCFAAPGNGAPELLMHRAACAPAHSENRLPYWMRRVDPIMAAYRRLLELTGPEDSVREVTDPLAIADVLDGARIAMDPYRTMATLRAENRSAEAVTLAYTVPPGAVTYDALLLAAEIASLDLGSSREALSLLDLAVQAAPERIEAYVVQVREISRLSRRQVDAHVAREHDATIRAAYDALSSEARRRQAHEFAEYLLVRGEPDEANTFAYRWLHDDAGALMWWQIGLMLDYAESFLRLHQPESAAQVLAAVKNGLRRLRENGQMPGPEIHRHGLRLADLEIRLRENGSTP